MTVRNSLRRSLLATGFLGLALSAAAQSLTITTLAGQTGASGSVDGTGAAARFSSLINSIVADASGTLHVIDANNYTVRRVTAAGVVTTIAGTAGQRAYVDGTGTAARFYNPRGLVRDAAGNLYLADTNPTAGFAHMVRKISPAGVVTTHLWNVRGATALAFDAAGNLIIAGGARFQGFTAAGVELLPPWAPGLVASDTVSALAIGRDGSYYLLISIGHEVRKMTPAGVVTPFVGAAGVSGYADGAGANARFSFPHGIALDSAGNAYVTDGNNPAVRKITPAGVVTTVAGAVGAPFVPGVFPDGIGSDVRFFGLSSLTVGADDTVYLGEFGAIRKGAIVNSAAKVSIPPQSLIVSAGERATFTVAASGYPAVRYQWQRSNLAGPVWTNVTDVGIFSGATTAVLVINGVTPAMNGDRFRCMVVNSLGSDTSAAASLTVDPPVVVVPLRVSTLAGRAGVQGGADGAGASASFNWPTGIATDASGNVFVSDTTGNRIRKITPGGAVTTLAGSGVAGAADGTGTGAQFRQPGAMAVDALGNVFVADQLFVPDYALLPVIRKVTPAGVVTTFARGTTAGPRFNDIRGLAFDRAGNLVVASLAEGILRYAPNGTLITVPFAASPLPGRGGIAFDAAGNFYYSDTGNHAIFKFTGTGTPSVIGRPGMAGAADGRAAVAMFRSPQGLAVDSTGNVFVADSGNHVIRRITPAGMVSTVAAVKPTANQTNPTGSADGIGSIARFYSPRGITIDRAGNLYIADTQNHTVRRALPVDAISVGQSTALYAQNTESESTSALSREPPRAALGPGSTYQWFKNSTAIAGATSEQLLLASVGLSDQGSYAVQVTTSDGNLMSEPVMLAVTGSRLINLSIRSYAGAAAETLIVGFVVSGPGLPLLARGIGPALAPFGVAGVLSNPRLALHSNDTVLASNAGWGNSSDLADAAARVGAFALPANSVDAVVLPTLDSGAFTVQCAADSGLAGVALVELYDAGLADAARSRLMNVSARSRVGAGDDVMIAGFSIRGAAPVRVLLRGVGPTLGLFGVEGALADPRLRLFDSKGNLQAQNDDWSDSPNAGDIAAVSSSVGAFPLPERSKDTALLVSLNPGNYSIHVSGAGAASGIALVEVYEAP